MDLAMPIVDGLTATKIITETDNFQKIPIIGLTAYGNYNEKAIEAGCNEVISKPLNFESLEPLLRHYLSD
jgi:CheY-like chemotaxis protein